MTRTITLKNVTKNFKNDALATNVLKGIDLKIQSTEFTSLIGPSGSGKSTLLSLIGTLDKPTTGQIFFDDQETTILKNSQLADIRFNEIGFVFQQYHLLPTLTALENVSAPAFTRRVPYNKEKRAKELLEQVGLGDKFQSLPSQLSGGQQQRVAIARSLLNDPTWLLADEPTGNLDSENSEVIFQILEKLNKEKGIGVLMVTHDVELAGKTDRMIKMKDGLVLHDGVTT